MKINVHHYFHADPETAAYQDRVEAKIDKLVAATRKLEANVVQRLETLSTQLAEYVAAVTAYITTVDEAVAAAVAADDAGEDTAITTMRDTIAAAKAALPVPPTPPEPV